MILMLLKEQIARFLFVTATFLEIKTAIGCRNVVFTGKSEQSGGAVDSNRRSLKLEEKADRRFIELNFQVSDAGERVGCPEFFVTKDWAQSQCGQNLGYSIPGNIHFHFFPDLVLFPVF